MSEATPAAAPAAAPAPTPAAATAPVATDAAAPATAEAPKPKQTLAERDKSIRARLRKGEKKPEPEAEPAAETEAAPAEPEAKPEPKPDEPADEGDEAGKRIDFAKWEKKLRKTEQAIAAERAAFAAEREKAEKDRALFQSDPVAAMKAHGFDLRAWVDTEIKKAGLSPEELAREQLAAEVNGTREELAALKKALDEARDETAKDRALRNSAARLARVDWAKFPHLSAAGEDEGPEMVIATVQDYERRGIDFDEALVAIEGELRAQLEWTHAKWERIHGAPPPVAAAPPAAKPLPTGEPGTATVTSRTAGAAGLPPPKSLRDLDARARAKLKSA